jgi:hypothetical protein
MSNISTSLEDLGYLTISTNVLSLAVYNRKLFDGTWLLFDPSWKYKLICILGTSNEVIITSYAIVSFVKALFACTVRNEKISLGKDAAIKLLAFASASVLITNVVSAILAGKNNSGSRHGML